MEFGCLDFVSGDEIEFVFIFFLVLNSTREREISFNFQLDVYVQLRILELRSQLFVLFRKNV